MREDCDEKLKRAIKNGNVTKNNLSLLQQIIKNAESQVNGFTDMMQKCTTKLNNIDEVNCNVIMV